MLDGQPGSPSQCLCAGMWVSSQSCSISASSSSSKHSSLPSEVPCTEQQCQQPGERSQGRALGINVQGGQRQQPHLLLGLAASWAPRGDESSPGKGFRGNRSHPNMASLPSFPLSIAKFGCVPSKKNCSAKSQGLALKISARPLYCKIKASSLLNTPLIRTVRNICNHVKLE